MKYIHINLVLCFLITMFPVILKAQTTDMISITAIISDTQGRPLSGAIVRSELDHTINAVSDSLGTFSMNVVPDSEIAISASGYKTKTVIATSELSEISLDLDINMVQVAHRKVDIRSLSNDVSVVNVEQLLEKNYMIGSMENMEAFANGFHGNIWGMDQYLVLVDGVPRDASSVMPTEIEHVTFLKGVAAVALYGSRAAKGVMFISTKRGKTKGLEVNVRANSGLHTPRMIPQYLGSAEYMTLYNEALRNDGLPPSPNYNEEAIYRHALGNNPYRYPDVDFYSSEYLKKAFSRHDGTIEISGGNEKARYYTNVGFNTQGDLLNFGEAVNNRSDRLNVRGNIDVDLNEFIWARVDAAAIYQNVRGVHTDYWGQAATLRPHRFTPLVPMDMVEANDDASWAMMNNTRNIINGRYVLGGTQLEPTNPFAAIYAGGHNKWSNRQFQFNTGVGANLKNILEGLTFESNFGLDYSTSFNQSFNNNYAVFEPSWNNYAGYDQITSLTQYGIDGRDGIQHIHGSWFRQTMAFSAQFNYFKTIGNRHNISTMLVANGFQTSETGMYHRHSNANLGLHLGYSYRNKYYADFNGAVVHSAKLPKDNRQAFSPTMTLGWRISEEDFMSFSSIVDNLKFSVSAGILHTDLNHEYYSYTSNFTQTDGAWYSWRDGVLTRSTDSRQGANPDLTFARREEINVGVEASLFQKLITFQGSFFANHMTGNVIQPHALYPNYFETGWPNSSFLPWINYNTDQRVGFDFNLNFNKNIGSVDYTLGFVGSFFETKAIKRAEIYEDDYQYREGKPLDAIWGLKNDGFFNENEQIAESPTQLFGQVSPGDIKYIDENGDGIVNNQDQVYLGRFGWYGSPLTLGVNFNAKWKNFNFFALGLGRYGAQALKSNSYFWVKGEDKYSVVVRDRWTEETKETASFPRLTTSSGDNNFQSSDFWLYSTNRFDLAKVQITYDVPQHVLGKSFVRDLGIFVSGFNLLTIAPERKILEMNVGSAPQTRFFNVGVTALF